MAGKGRQEQAVESRSFHRHALTMKLSSSESGSEMRRRMGEKLGFGEARLTMASCYNIFGIIVASLACLNFLSSLVHLPLVTVVQQFLATYRAIVHGILDWVTVPFHFQIPDPVKDAMFIYGIVGGGFMRARMTDEGCKGSARDAKSIWTLLGVLIWPKRPHGLIAVPGEIGLSTNYRLVAIYKNAPSWLRRAMDFLLWPRVARQFWENPRVFRNDYLGTFPSFPKGYSPGQQKVFIYDRRYRFYVQIGSVLAIVFATIIINGFLTIPK